MRKYAGLRTGGADGAPLPKPDAPPEPSPSPLADDGGGETAVIISTQSSRAASSAAHGSQATARERHHENADAGAQASTTDLLLALARCHAQCSVKLRPTDPAAADIQVNSAVEAVRDAVAAGYRDRVTLTIDPDMLPLQSLSAYREIVAEIAAP